MARTVKADISQLDETGLRFALSECLLRLEAAERLRGFVEILADDGILKSSPVYQQEARFLVAAFDRVKGE